MSIKSILERVGKGVEKRECHHFNDILAKLSTADKMAEALGLLVKYFNNKQTITVFEDELNIQAKQALQEWRSR